MAENSYPYRDQEISDADYSDFARDYAPSGVVKRTTDASDLKVSADSTGMKVKVAAGRANLRGHRYKNTATKELLIDPKDDNPRVDAVVVRSEYGSVKAATLVVKKGKPAASPTAPVAPSLEQTLDGIWEELLAEVSVSASAVTITAANVTDRRKLITPGELPPLIHADAARGGKAYDGTSRLIIKTGSRVVMALPNSSGSFLWQDRGQPSPFPNGLISVTLTPGDAATATTQLIVAGGTGLGQCQFVARGAGGAGVGAVQVRVEFIAIGW